MQTMDGTTRDWPGQGAASSITYPRAQRLLGIALSRLAATGYPVPPDEAADLIHDFYVEAWGQAIARFDPSLAKLETYVFACFLRFARPRIARLDRLRSTLMAPAEMESILGTGGGDVAAEADGSDILATRRAVAALPDESRQLLTSYIDDVRPSERALADRFDLTRYQLRTRLADALGRIAVELGASKSFAEPDRAIATVLWADNRSSREAANLLDLPIAEIQAARRRIFARLVRAVKGSKPMTKSDTPDEAGTASIRSLVAAALSSAATADDLAAVRNRVDAVWRYLGTIERDEAQALSEAADTTRLVAFYAALGDEPAWPNAQSSAALAPFLVARDDEERSIGEAFAQALIVNLPDRLTELGRFFAAAPTLEPEIHEAFSRDPSVEAAGAPAAELARFGIAPLTIAEAARAISNLAEQVGREIGIGIGDRLALVEAEENRADPPHAVITRRMVIDELAMSFDLPDRTTTLLFDWIFEVAARKPLLFDGYRTMPRGRDLVLLNTGITEQDLFRRWRSDALPVADVSPPRRETTAAA